MTKTIDQDPTIDDEILFTITTTDGNNNLVDPSTVDVISIYFVERSFFDPNLKSNIDIEPEGDYTTYFNQAISVASFGAPGDSVWNSSNPSASMLTHVTVDSNNNVLHGTFTIPWQPDNGEGDYFICWTWTYNGNQLSNFYPFFVGSSTLETTSIPTHVTPSDKYTTLLSRYMPEMVSIQLKDSDLTPDVIARYNAAIAKMFTFLEDLTNQSLDLIDANATPKYILPYLGNLFGLKLRSQDTTLWRKQIKQAITLYKQKGTLNGLTAALSNADITLNSFTMLWQVVSSSTWQEGILVTVDDQITFTLEKLAILPVDLNNFSIAIRPVNTSSYMLLSLNQYVTFANANGITTMTWVGENAPSPIVLAKGDFLQVIYLISPVTNQSLENYIRTLPLADTRDETTFTYPVKNWNVRLITEDDSMFSSICSVQHPFVNPLVFGQIRTEFPYSENIYNMDEYSGSIRASTAPCDLDKSFLDTCSCCQSSSFNIAVTIDGLSDDRIKEANDIINSFKPFHLRMQNISYKGSFSDIMVPPIENITFLVEYSPNDVLVTGGEDLFNRSMMLTGGKDSSFNAPVRTALAAPTMIVNSAAGTGFNQAYVLYAPNIRFDLLGLNVSNNLLEILSGTSTGNYTANLSGNNTIQVNQGSPSNLPYPLEAGQHNFRLSNIIYQNASASIYQDSLFVFSDSSINFGQYPILASTSSITPWKVVISNGSNPGTYTVNTVLPNNTLLINSWPGVNQLNLNYQLQDNNSQVIFSSTSGAIQVTNRGRVEVTDNLQAGFGVTIGYYVLYNSNQYEVNGFNANNKVYIDGYNSGTVVGTASIKILKRLVNNNLGFLDVQGMYITSIVNYETALGIKNGNNQSIDGVADVDSNFKENYQIVINGATYKIYKWIGNNIYIKGTKLNWSLSGTSILYSINLYNKTSPITMEDHVFRKVDRSGNDVFTITSQAVSPMFALSDNNNNMFIDKIGQSESVSITIQKV